MAALPRSPNIGAELKLGPARSICVQQEMRPRADLEVGDTAGLETCATIGRTSKFDLMW